MKKRILLLCVFPLISNAQCIISSLNTTIGPCNSNDQYQIIWDVDFMNAPATGNLVLEVNDGITVYDTLLALPITSPLNGATLSFLPSNGNACTATAYFSADPGCSISINYTAPSSCTCTADAGTFNQTITGNSILGGVLTWGDQLTLESDSNFVIDSMPTPIPYNPGLSYLIYSCPPNLNDLPSVDTCLIGIAEIGSDYFDVNNASSIYYTIPSSDIQNNTVYYVPLTVYDTVNMNFAVSLNGSDWCYDYGSIYPVMYLTDIGLSISTNPGNGSVDFTLSGALPSVDGSNFTVSNILPITAVPSQTSVANNGSFTLSGLQDGQNYSFTITDDAGSTKQVEEMYLDLNEINANQIIISPNPFSETINIEGAQDFEVAYLRDQQGRLILTLDGNQGTVFHTESLAKGFYFIEIHENGRVRSEAVVKN